MEKITLTIKDKKKKDFFFELLQQLDFIELENASKKSNSRHNFFASAGQWSKKTIDAKKLREQAWKRSK
jgi:hypothetical protein